MNLLPRLFGLVLLVLTLVVSAGVSQDAKKDDKKPKAQLPAGFKDLGLTAEQKAKVYSVIGEYKVKISELDKQIKELRKKEMQEVFMVLTEEQRKKYLDAKGVETKDKKKDSDKK